MTTDIPSVTVVPVLYDLSFTYVGLQCIFVDNFRILALQNNKEDRLLNKTFNVFSVIALILTIVGALNWLTIGIFGFNFVNWITFGMGWLERVLYILVGAAGVYMIVWLCVSRFNMVEDGEQRGNTRHAYRHYDKSYGNE